MNILMLNYEYPPIGGGAGQAHQNLINQYAQIENLRVDLLTSGLQSGFNHETPAPNINIYKVGIAKKDLHYWRKSEVCLWLYRASKHYSRMIHQNNYDLVHAFFAFPSGWLCYRSADKLPYIVSLRGSDVPGYNTRLGLDYKLLARLFRNIWQNAAAVIPNSTGLRDLAQKFTPDIDMPVIANGIDTQRFEPPEQRQISNPAKLLTVCRLITRKRIEILIETIALLKQKGRNAQLSIVGHGNLLPTLKDQAKSLNISANIIFMEQVVPENMPRIYREHEIFLMSSAHEGMSNAMLEAMASGLPIITNRCEGVDELVKDNGIILPQAQPQSFTDAVINLTNNNQTYQTMSEAARKHAYNFTWPGVAQQYLKIYESIIK